MACLRDERGTIAPLAVASALVLAAALALFVDQALAYAVKADQENAIDAARSRCMSASCALPAKNAERPGAVLADEIAEALGEDGFTGSVDVWFYEAPAADMPDSRRLWIVGIQMYEDCPTVFARGLGVDSIPVASNRIITAEPYAGSVTWRPDDSGIGKYTYAAGALSGSPNYERMDDLGRFPDELVAAARAATETGGREKAAI